MDNYPHCTYIDHISPSSARQREQFLRPPTESRKTIASEIALYGIQNVKQCIHPINIYDHVMRLCVYTHTCTHTQLYKL